MPISIFENAYKTTNGKAYISAFIFLIMADLDTILQTTAFVSTTALTAVGCAVYMKGVFNVAGAYIQGPEHYGTYVKNALSFIKFLKDVATMPIQDVFRLVRNPDEFNRKYGERLSQYFTQKPITE